MLGLEIVLIISVISIAFAAYLGWYVMKKDTGTEKMMEISNAITEGAKAFLRRQYWTISVISIILAALIFASYSFIGKQEIGILTTISFIFGAFSSGLAGFIGMHAAIRTNIRSASAARRSLNEALVIALRGGAVSGIVIVVMSLLGITVLYLILGMLGHPVTEIPFLIVGYGFGASFVALFAQLGGGIYTKGADVGADLVGKVEAGIPEDDARNPAVIADLVGDNVGDCAGRGADLFESTAAENIGAMILGVALFPVFGIAGILFPLVVRAFGLIASIVGIMSVRTDGKEKPMKALNRGYYITAGLATVFLYFVSMDLLNAAAYPDAATYLFGAGVIGILASIAIVWITGYYTESDFSPVKKIALASKTGHATNVITGFAVGLESTGLPVLVLGFALIASYALGEATGIHYGGLYGTAIATMGMLSTAAYVLAMDTFGPIVDNAGGIVEMGKEKGMAAEITAKLDAAGNTTKALTKGYAIGSAALAAFLLFSAYLQDVGKILNLETVAIDISKVDVFVGALLGAMLVFVFSSFAIRAVGNTAFTIVEEVRRQFREIPGIMKGKAKPDYAKCVDICAQSALKEMVLPGIMVVVMTLLVGILLKWEAAGAFLMVGTISGILMALFLNTGGGAWDNAKKYIEEGQHGGRGSDSHKAAVTGDTIGDPFKDTAGPSIHVLIKLIGTLTLVLLPLFI